MAKKKSGCGRAFALVVVAIAVAVIVTIVVNTDASGSSSSSSSQKSDIQIATELTSAFADGESGIVSFRVDGSLIYVGIDTSVPASDAPPMSRAWAITLSKEYRSGRNCTAYIMRGSTVLAKITYSTRRGFRL